MTAVCTPNSVAEYMATPRARALLYPHTFAAWASGGEWQAWKIWRHVGKIVGEAIVRGNARVIVNMPPGMGKSQFLSVWTSIWFLENFPDRRVINATNSQRLANRNGRDVRNQFQFNPALRTRVSEDSAAKGQWNTHKGGGMLATSIGASSIGFRGHLITIDDPYGRWSDAYSAAYKDELESWFDATARTRLEPGGSIVLLHHRFAVNDLTGVLLANSGEDWTHVSIPAHALEDDPMGRKPGEWIGDRFTSEEVESARNAMAGVIWDAMYQQRPQLVGVGACYRNFSGANVDDRLELDPTRPLQVSLDYNIDPGMHAEIGQHLGDRDVLTAVHEVHGPRMSVPECLAQVKAVADRYGPFPEWHVFADPAGTSANASTGESHHQTVKRFLAANGVRYSWRVRVAHAPVVDRINAFNDALRGADDKAHYLVHPRCKRLVNDLSKVQADEDGKPDKRNRELTHASDAEGYRVHMIRPIRAHTKPDGKVTFGTGAY